MSDVYVACRTIGGVMKFSMHDSGQWHVAFTREFFRGDNFQGPGQRPEERFVDMWGRPPPRPAGETLACRIVVPWDACTVRHLPTEDAEEPIWLPPAPAPNARFILIFLIPAIAPVPAGSWPGQPQGAELIGSIILDNGETVWIVHTNGAYEPPGGEHANPVLFAGAQLQDLMRGELRMVRHSRDGEGLLTMLETQIVVTVNT